MSRTAIANLVSKVLEGHGPLTVLGTVDLVEALIPKSLLIEARGESISLIKACRSRLISTLMTIAATSPFTSRMPERRNRYGVTTRPWAWQWKPDHETVIAGTDHDFVNDTCPCCGQALPTP